MFDKLIIKNSLKYRLLFVGGGVIHLVFLLIFLAKQIYPAAIFNVFSIVLYVLGAVFGVNRVTGKMRYGFMVAFYAEILVHSVLATLFVGAEGDFQLYAVVILPVAVYVLFFSCKIQKFVITIVSFAVLCVAGLVASTMIVQNNEMLPLYPLTYSEKEMFRLLNLAFSGSMLVVFSMAFALEVYFLIKRLNDANQQLEYTAAHDALTGLYNRHSLKSLFEELSDSPQNFCVALGDIDDFKKVNDTYGHDGGDSVLKSISKLIVNGIDGGDIACRWGGEEILVIMRGSREECYRRIEQIHTVIRQNNVKSGGDDISVTMTFGFAEKNPELDIEALISLADDRLYCGKKHGKNVIVSE